MKIQNYCDSALSALWQHKKMASVLSGVSLLLAGYLLYTAYHRQKKPNNPLPSNDRNIAPYVFPEIGQRYENGVIGTEDPMPFIPLDILKMFFNYLPEERDQRALACVSPNFHLVHACISTTFTIQRVAQLLTNGNYSYLLPFATVLKDIPLQDFQVNLLKGATRLRSLSVHVNNNSQDEIDKLPQCVQVLIPQQQTEFKVTFTPKNAGAIRAKLNSIIFSKRIAFTEVIFSLEQDICEYTFDFYSKKVCILLPKTNPYFYLPLMTIPITKLHINNPVKSSFMNFLVSDKAQSLEHLQIGFPHGIDFTIDDFAVLCTRCPNLQSLTLKTTAPIDENVIDSLKTLKNLMQIRFWIPEHSKAPSVEDLQRVCQNLNMRHSQIHQCHS